MYGPPGFAYVYIIYGMHYCMNVVTADINKPEAVLIRALEPVSGIETMSQNRYGREYDMLTRTSLINLTNGPGKLCKSLGINKSNNGDDLCKDRLFIVEDYTTKNFLVESSPRINIDYAEEAAHYLWRFYIKDNTFVSYRKRDKA